MKDKIYYCNITGQVLLVLASLVNVKETTFEEDYKIYSSLSERTKESIDLIELEFGKFVDISNNSTGMRVDLETNKLVFSYDELPIKPTLDEIVKEQGNKISNLEDKNEALLESQKVQDRTIIETDMKMMDLEFLLEDLIMGVGVNTKINLSEVFTMERSEVYFNQLRQMIEMENYDSKEDMERILNKYASGTRPRITQEEYNELFDLLYPSKYDISTK